MHNETLPVVVLLPQRMGLNVIEAVDNHLGKEQNKRQPPLKKKVLNDLQEA